MDYMVPVAVGGILQILLSVLFIVLAWWALQSVRWDLFFLKPASLKTKILHLMLAIVIGSQVALFFSNYINWSSWLKYLF